MGDVEVALVGEMKVGYIPFDNAGNAYTERNKEILARIGAVCKVPKFGELIRSPWLLKIKSYDCIIANWIENCLINKHGRVSAVGVLKFFAGIVAIKLLAKKSIFVRHNNYPHDAVGVHGRLASRIIDMAESLFDAVVTHSGHNESGGRKYIPHPLYNVVSGGVDAGSSSEGYFLAFGRILPYKKLELLIAGLPVNVRLLVVGSAPDKDYVEVLRRTALGKSVEIIAEFVSDERVGELARCSRGIVVAHSDNDMVVSGTFFYALSLKVPVFMVKTHFAEWVDKELKIPGVHVYSSLNDLCSALGGGRVREGEGPGDVEYLFGDPIVEAGWRELLS